MNLAKIAEALEVNLIQLFAYVEEEMKITLMDRSIQEIVDMLREANEEKMKLAKNVLKEILKTDTSS